MSTQRRFIARLFLLAGIICMTASLHAQTIVSKNGKNIRMYKAIDSTQKKSATSKTTKSKTTATSTTTMSLMSGGGGCSIYGESSPVIGQQYTYTISCSTEQFVSYWSNSGSCSAPTVISNSGNTLVLVWNGGCSQDELTAWDGESNVIASMYVYPISGALPLTGGSITTSAASICPGASAGTINTNAATEGDCGGSYSYQWQSSYDNSSWSDISGETGSTYNPGTLYSSTYYRRKVTCGSETAYTGSVKFTIYASTPTPVITGNSSVQCNGSTTLSVYNYMGGGYQNYWWYDAGNNLLSTASTLSAGAGTYHVTTANNGCNATSSNFTISMSSAPAPTLSTTKAVLCNNESAVISVTNTSNFSSYQWFKDFSGTPISGETSSSLYVTAGGYYTCKGITGLGCDGTSSPMYILAVSLTPSISVSGATSFCQGDSVGLTANPGSATYQWIKDESNMSGYTDQSHTLYSSGNYKVRVTEEHGCVATSPAQTITVYSLPTASINPSSSQGYCPNGSTTLTAASAGGSFQWYAEGGAHAVLSGYNNSFYPFTAGDYSVRVSNTHGCWSDFSSTVNVYQKTLVTPTVSGAANVDCNGQTTLAAYNSAIGGNGSFESYKWYDQSNNQISSAATITVGPGNYHVETYYNGCAAISGGFALAANPQTVPTLNSTPSFVCSNSSIQLSINNTGYFTSYQWYKNGTALSGQTSSALTVTGAGDYYCLGRTTLGCNVPSDTRHIDLSIITTPTISASGPIVFCQNGNVVLTASSANSYQWIGGSTLTTNAVTATTSGDYSVRVTNSDNCTATSLPVTVTVYSLPSAAVTVTGPTTFCEGGSVALSASAGNTYLWNDGKTTQVINPTTGGTYSVIVTNGNNCSAYSTGTTVVVNTKPVLQSITGNASICQSASTLLSCATSGGVWSSDNSAIVSVNSAGTITGIAPGTATISYTVTNGSNCSTSVTKTITTNPSPAVSTITGGPAVKVNTQKQLTSSPSGGVWNSNATSIASIDSTGLVNGLLAGTGSIDYTVTNQYGCIKNVTATITVYNPLQNPVISPTSSAADYSGNGVPIQKTGTITGGYGAYTYQWQYTYDTTTTWQNISGATGTSYQPNGIINTSYYRLVVTSGADVANSNIAFVSLPLNGGIISSSLATVTSGGGATLQSVQVATGGNGAGTYTYQWQSSADRINWQAMGSTTISNLTRSTFYRRQVSSNGVIAYSNDICIRVKDAITTLNAPTGATAPAAGTQTLIAIPANTESTDGENLNFIRTRNITKPGITDTVTARTLTGAFDAQQSTTYFDGLARPMQTVAKQASGSAKDLVSINVYDPFGREAQKFLPYADAQASGMFRKDADSKQPDFYNTQLSNTESYYYSNTVFEASPLNRVLKTTAPGKSFTGNNIGISQIDRTNAVYDSVRIWEPGNNALPISTGRYLPGTLMVQETTDENDNTVITYKDIEGHVVLKKVQETDALQPGHSGWLCTYYVYDDLGQLRHVFSPKAVQSLVGNNWTLTQSVSDELCFNYTYDYRQRMVTKKVPGAGVVNMIYDKRDRLVYTQDANMRSKTQWLYTLYDVLNRPVETGMMTGYSGTATDLQAVVNSITGSGSITQNTSGGTTPSTIQGDLTIAVRHAGDTSYIASNSITFTDGFTSEANASFTAQIISGGNGGSFTSTVSVLDDPLPSTGARIPLTFTYYDSYSATQKSFNSSFAAKLDPGNNAYADAAPTAASVLARGNATSARVRVLENPDDLNAGNWLETAFFFDNKGRSIQTQSDNYKGGIDIASTRYEFAGKPVSIYQSHTNAVAGVTMTVRTTMDYDHVGRIIAIRKTLNDSTNATRTISTNSYDELGQLKNKKLGQRRADDGSLSTNPLENQDYAYNIRGWLQSINKDYATAAATPPSGSNGVWFGMRLFYDWGYGTNQYNGNIAGQKWMTAGDPVERSFGYGYDNVNRLLNADYYQKNGSTWAKNDGGSITMDFSVKMGDGINSASAYDANGNILKMQQMGLKLNASNLIDDLQYNYIAGTNKLKNVLDAQNDPDTKLGDFRSSTTYMTALGTKTAAAQDYDYDSNGNLSKDLNKDILSTGGTNGITYNHLNLPSRITVSGKGTITYIYDAAGNKLEKRSDETAISKTTKTAYIGGVVYRNDTLQFMAHEEGRIRKKDTAFVYDYFLKDHLGNTRMVLTDEWEVNAYPAASMETAQSAVENALYSNIDATRTAKPAGYPADTYTNPNDQVAKLNGNGNKIGPGIILKVMSGDKVNIRANSWYKLSGGSPGTPINPLNDLINALASGISTNMANWGKFTNTQLQQTGVLSPGIGNLLAQQTNNYTNTAQPKAYLNWLLLDEQFKIVNSSSGFEQVGADQEFKTWVKTNLPINKNGYLYVYCSNESQIDVFFDNLQVSHVRGPLLSEDHFYPFGLKMAGISSVAAGKLENKKNKFQGQEYNDDLGVDMYEFKWRMDDPQTGRFWQVDPLADKYVYNSTYAFSENKVTGHVEIEGLEAANANDIRSPYVRAALKDDVQRDVQSMKRNGSEAVQVKLSVGVGVGATAGVGSVKVGGSVNGPQVEASVNGGGKVDAKGSMAGVAIKGELPGGEVKAGANVGVVQMSDGKTTVNAATGSASADITASKTNGSGDLSQSMGGKLLNATITVGAKLGVVGVEASINVYKAGAAVVSFFKAGAEWMSNVVKDMAPKPPTLDPPQK